VITTDNLIPFLVEHGLYGDEIEFWWTCPLCGANNIGTYYTRESPCHNCGKFCYPQLTCGSDAHIKNEVIKKEIKRLTNQIERIERDISDLEEELGELRYERKSFELIIKGNQSDAK
jgi:hypothetical protein